IWNGAGWHQMRTASAPDNTTRNAGSAIAYDSTHDQTVFFEYVYSSSAAGPQYLPQTWTFDGANWTKHTASPVAPPLSALLADDPAGGGILAFGGITGLISGGKQPVYGTATWHWDGARWTQLQPAAAPTSDDAKYGVMTTDTHARQAILVNQHTGMVWTWDGATWTAHHPASVPPARDGAALVFDGQSQSVLLISGYDHESGQQVGVVWQWNGNDWSQLAVTGTPATIGTEGAIYDAQMQALVAYVCQTWIWSGSGAWHKLG
ncbi:MAG: hypothetical protein ACRDHP_03835, partial [Ktedonobacterales bacterium]